MKLRGLALLTLLGLVQAHPSQLHDKVNHEPEHKQCISDKEADKLLHEFVSLFQKIDDNLARRILTKDFTVYSRATNFLQGKTVSFGTLQTMLLLICLIGRRNFYWP